MKVLFLTSNTTSKPLFSWLNKRCCVVQVSSKLTEETFMSILPDIVISYSYKFLIPESILNLKSGCFLNLHISALPFNRGADPNVWSFLEDTPKGVTIHQMSPELDSGNIVLQKIIDIDETKHTLASSYALLHSAIQELFMTNWEYIKALNFSPIHSNYTGTFHTSSQFNEIREHCLSHDGWDVSIPIVKERYQKLKIENSGCLEFPHQEYNKNRNRE